jgi:two-component system, NtrC family, sensor kinase
MSGTVLIIDDSLTFREALRKALEAASYNVIVAITGEEGLRIAADRRPTAIVVDGMLPGIDGITVIRRIRLDAALRHTPCLLLTASELPGAEIIALDAGADAFVQKDGDIDVILARLTAIIHNARESTNGHDVVSSFASKRILAVDDDDAYLYLLAKSLRKNGYEVILARSGEEALNLLAVQSVDCILLDLFMPDIDGKETCCRVKAVPITRDIPVIMLTALEDRDMMIQSFSAGADDYIAKSSDLEVLHARVLAQLRRKQFENENRLIREKLLRHEMEARASRELAEARAILVEELQRKNQELEAFSYSVSHDLRAPLRSIDGFSQALLEDYSNCLDQTGQKYLQRVRSAAQRMGHLIDDLLKLSKIGRSALKRQPVNLSVLAQSIAADLQRTSPDRNAQFLIADEIMGYGDMGLLRIVLENLIGNAWKFTSSSMMPVIEFGNQIQDNETVYFVRDNGAGFNMNYVNKLFTPFQRLHSEAEFSGTGIGLATVQRIIARHGGRVWADGSIHQGATFFWTLPTSGSGGEE